MPFYAHIETGRALDIHEHPNQASYEKWARLVRAQNWTIAEVPAGTQHGATPNGGAWDNPLGTPPQKRQLSLEEVLDLLPAAVVKALHESTSAAVIKRFHKARARATFTWDDGVKLGNDLEAAAMFTPQQNIDFKAAWPTS